MTEFVGDDLTIPLRVKRQMADGILGHLHPDEVAGEIFTHSDDGRLPTPTGPSSRLRYVLALTAEAERIRTRSPELFISAGSSYMHDRHAFRATFKRIQPPLLWYGPLGLRSSRSTPGWTEFFLATGIHAEVLRGLVMYDARTLGRRLAPYHRIDPGLLHTVLDGVLRGAPAAEAIRRHAEAAEEPS